MTKMPPVPPEQRKRKGPAEVYQDVKETEPSEVLRDFEKENAEQKGQQGNIRQNTRNQGYRQDR
ncbi:hypothetical protein [Bradyrhizobium sp. LHD-71]|uniref:hypothetical protein n=1 Tax=Bradyrhizobium sp. LHD-71 TaxID=3072141 RepID=UPI00280F2AB7|nr:hypothetical protein [Bradyrhizobium sp. LHD-71]MDQ8729419.1 hypothetical protein [Bradyrhizobium sp. LHD-71]